VLGQFFDVDVDVDVDVEVEVEVLGAVSKGQY
jgi:hypothetical protein